MPEFLLCSTSCRRDSIERELGVPPDQLCDPYSPREKSVSYVQAYRPYMLLDPGINLRMTHGYYQGASPIYHASGYVQQNIFDLVQRYGQDVTLGLATIMNDKVSGGLNSSAEVMGKRLDHFSKAIQEYQAALLKLRDAYQLPDKAVARAARETAQHAFEAMQTRFRSELSLHSTAAWGRQRNPLTNFDRANHIARSSRTTVKLHVADHSQALQLVRFGTYAKVLGNGITAIDFGSRIGEIQNEYKAGGDWNKTMFVESLSFAASTYIGSVTASAGVSALVFLVAATPVGWVGLIVAGAVVAATAVGATAVTNDVLRSNSGDWYDAIMTQLR